MIKLVTLYKSVGIAADRLFLEFIYQFQLINSLDFESDSH